MINAKEVYSSLNYPINVTKVSGMKIQKILIAEDEELFVDSLSRKLTRLGYIVENAFDGEKAFEKALSFLPDLILLDVKMPKINGIKLCKKLRSNRKTNKIHIVMLSALTQPQDVQEGYAAGADRYLRKPLIFPDLVELLDQWGKK